MKKEIIVIGWLGVAFAVIWSGLIAHMALSPSFASGFAAQPFLHLSIFYSWLMAASYPFFVPFGAALALRFHDKKLRYGTLAIIGAGVISSLCTLLHPNMAGTGFLEVTPVATGLIGALSFPVLVSAFIHSNLPKTVVCKRPVAATA